MHEGPALICAGTSPDAAAAVARHAAALLAGRRALVLSVWDAEAPEALQGELRGAAETAAQAADDELRAAGWETLHRVKGAVEPPWHVALHVADEIDAAVIVVAGQQRSDAPSGSLGRETRALAHNASRPLLVVPRSGQPAEQGPIFAAYDGSEPARAALAAATELLARRPVVVGSVARALSGASAARQAFNEESHAHARKLAAEGAERLADWDAQGVGLLTEDPLWAGLAHSARDAAVIVAGNRGHSRIAAVLLGSVAEGLLRHAERPVLLVGERS